MPSIAKNKQKEKIKFSLKAIELLDMSLTHLKKPLANPVVFQFDIKLEHRLNNELKMIFVVIYIDIFNENRDNKLGSISVSSIFEVANFEDFVNKEKNLLNLPEEAATMLNSIAISTTRGVMFSQFRGTSLHNAILPLVDIKSFQLKQQEKTN